MARKGKATYDDLLKLPEHVVGEIIAGELFVSPRPASPHARASSMTARLDRTRKMSVYAQVQVPHLGILDPLAQTLGVFSLQDGSWVLASPHAENEKVRAVPFDAVELDLARWWLE